MMTARFPKKGPDGSFCVLISLRVETDDLGQLRSKVSSWLEEWARAHQQSRHLWFGEEVRFEDEFATPPTAIECEEHRLGVMVECRPTAKWWKDVLVTGLLKEMLQAHGEIKDVERIGNCD